MQAANPFQELHDKLDFLTSTVISLTKQEKDTPKLTNKLLKIEEASQFLRMPISTIRFHIKHSLLPFMKPGKVLLFQEDKLSQWLTDLSSGKIKKQLETNTKTFPKR